MNELVSVIIPVYNPGLFLERCLQAVLNQTYRFFECVLIDDGSTDNSGEICDEYAKKDRRFKVIHQKNSGISKARNEGLHISGGSYICFIDADDEVEPDYLETLKSNIGDYECIACGFDSIDHEGLIKRQYKPNMLSLNSNTEIKTAYMNGSIKHWFSSPTAKMFVKQAISGLLFDPGMVVGEDIVYNLGFLSRADSVIIYPYQGYKLRTNIDSTTNRIHRLYSPLYEHSYTIIQDGIKNAKKKFGYTEEQLENEAIHSAPERYYNELSNLVRPGTPYSKNEIIQKINIINHDEKFIKRVKCNSFMTLNRAGKISFLCASIRSSSFAYNMFLWLVQSGH